MNRVFIDKQMSVMYEQISIMRDLLGRLELRMQDIEYELEEPIDFAYDYDAWVSDNKCNCPDCREDSSYRMD